jgi:hypothetical protein
MRLTVLEELFVTSDDPIGLDLEDADPVGTAIVTTGAASQAIAMTLGDRLRDFVDGCVKALDPLQGVNLL